MPETVDQKPVELTLGDGTVVKGADLQEAFNNLAKMKVDTAKYAQEQKERYETLQGQYQTLSAEVDKLKPKQSGNEFDKNEYYRMLNEDPIGAQNYLDTYRFGVQNPVERFNEVSQKADTLYQNHLTATFWARHPEFPGGKDSAKIMTERVQELVGEGHPLTADTMELAYSSLVGEEKIKPNVREEEEVRPNPTLGGGGGDKLGDQVSTEISKMEKMTTGEMEAYLRGKGMFR